MATPPYVELHAHSAFSFLDGASTPIELAAAAEAHGYPALALTDHDGLWGSREFAEACKGLAVRAITGAELTVRGSVGGAEWDPRTERLHRPQGSPSVRTRGHAHTSLSSSRAPRGTAISAVC